MKENFDLRLAWIDLKEDFNPGNIKKSIINVLLIVLGSLLLAGGDGLFLIPYKIVSGGMAGLGIVFNQAFNWDTNLAITIWQWVLFFIGFILLGARFSLRTLVSSITYPLFLYLFDYLLTFPEFASYISLGPINDNLAILLAGVFGGALVGIGCGLTFIGGGSTGGTDCLSLALSKYFNIKAAIGSFVIDLLIIISNAFFATNILVLLIGACSAFVCAMFIDKVYIGDNSYVCFIVSDHWEEINKLINEQMERGTTLIDSYGGYTGDDKVMIETVFTTDEYDQFQKIVFKVDPHAFITVLDAYEVTGFGFKKVPFRINREIKFEEKKNKKITNRKKNMQKIKDLSKNDPSYKPVQNVKKEEYNKKGALNKESVKEVKENGLK